MSAQTLDGAALARTMRDQIARTARALAEKGHKPGLAVILVGADPASQVYVRNKVRACAEAGIESWLDTLPEDTTEREVLASIARFNSNNAVDGILIQLPLPRHLDAHRILEAVAQEKDVDGLQMKSAGALLTGQPGFRPCTPLGIMRMLDHTEVTLAGRHAVVIGRSASVGKPVGLLLLERDATVTYCHSKTEGLADFTRAGDILIAAVGRSGLVRADMVKPGAIVIDVGINRKPDGKLCGDVEFETVREVAGWISPVPGGVGPMTITMLLENTVKSAHHRMKLT
jgi:methylenetetrahydrofolate dehydrogenase (NADP+) / methenyltetrahydrofolate cyclohydrolase